MKPAFVDLTTISSVRRHNEHGGCGAIEFRRLMKTSDFASRLDFVDFTVIEPGSSIGRHEHYGNEEFYFVANGTPIIRVNGEERRAERGTLAIVRSGQWHELINDTQDPVEILVVQVPVCT